MITKTIPTVHRFIPFTAVLLCASVFALPSIAFADTTYTLYDTGWSGATLTNVQGIDNADFYANGDFRVPHYSAITHIAYITSTTTPQQIHGNSDWSIAYSWGFAGSATSHYQPGPGSGAGPTYTAVDELNGVGSTASGLAGVAPVGDYLISFPGGNIANVETYCFVSWDGVSVDTSDCATPPGGVVDPCDMGDTRICGFTPENNDILTGPDIDFTLDYWISSDDLGGFLGNVSDVVVKLHNIDQNVLLLGSLSPNDIVLYDAVATSSGAFHFSTTTPLADGNYRIEASIKRKTLFDWITIPFSSVNQTISKQFIVGAPTLIGNLTQNGFNILNGTLASTSATSSIALVARCNPLGSFDVVSCLAGLFIPDSGQVNATIQGMKDGILTRLPWGYFTRFAQILTTTATSSLPTFTAEVAQNDASDTTTLSFDPGDMIAGGGALVDSIHDPYNNKTIKDIFSPIVQLVVALMVLFEIVSDLTGSHKNVGPSSPGDVASKRRRV